MIATVVGARLPRDVRLRRPVRGARTTGGRRARAPLGFRVVGRNGEPVDFVTSAVRNLLRIVDFLPLFYLVGSVSIVCVAARSAPRRPRRGHARRTRALRRTERRAAAGRTGDRAARAGAHLGRVRGRRRGGAGAAALPRPPPRTSPGRSGATLPGSCSTASGPKVPGLPMNAHPEYILEGIVVAKQGRA